MSASPSAPPAGDDLLDGRREVDGHRARARRARHAVAQPARRRGRREERPGRSASATTSARARSTPRSPRCARPANKAKGGDALRDARAVQPRRAHAAVHGRHPQGASSRASSSAAATRTRTSRAGASRSCAAAGVAVDIGCREAGGAQAHRAVVEVRDDGRARTSRSSSRSRSTGASRREPARRSG